MIRRDGQGQVLLHPGDLYFGQAPETIRTVLGSCISITLWHPKRHIGGMCHYMLPQRAGGRVDALDGRYGDEALALLEESALLLRTRLQDYQVKIFGGARMYPPRQGEQCEDVPCRNVLAGRALLAAKGITLAAEHVGGTGHRTLVFDLATGTVWMRQRQNGSTERLPALS